jgi:16S rRNA (uracil1498-N3)-methyltransferase
VPHIPRLYVPGHIKPGPLSLTREQAKRLTSVMRLQPGDELRVFSGDGREWRAVAGTVSKMGMLVDVRDLARQQPLPERVVEVWCALVRPNRFDWAIEKCVEAGADLIRPIVTDHAARGDGASPARQERWERIAAEAMEQSGRLHPAVMERPLPLTEALSRHHGALVMADGAGRLWPEVVPLLPLRGAVAVAIGPEGGWSEAELDRARRAGALVASLGPNTLRTETAAVVATALLRAR